MKKAPKKKKVVKKTDLTEAEKLNLRREKFCQLYTSDSEFFGNGTQAYIEAYQPNQSKPNWYKSSQANASRLLSNDMVLKRINQLLDSKGLNDGFVDKQLLFLITQNAEFGAKITAIREYNKLKKRITDKMDVTSDGLPIQVVSYKDIKK